MIEKDDNDNDQRLTATPCRSFFCSREQARYLIVVHVALKNVSHRQNVHSA
jgi:hypothetical protein